MAPSPPKPWERAQAPQAAASSMLATSGSTQPASASAPATSTSSTPALPDRPTTMTTSSSTTVPTAGYGATTSALSPYSATASPYASSYNRYGAGGYGGIGSYGGMGSYGGYGTGYGGGYGGYGSMMGGGYGGMGAYGAGYGGMGGMAGIGGYPMPGSPEELSLSQRMEHGTAQTFQMLQAIVGAFGGFAQMLESTFMATHSSFFAMIGVAEQFGHLRNYLGQVLSIFALVRWIKTMLYRLTGRTPPPSGSSASSISSAEFKAFETGTTGSNSSSKPKLAKKPLFVFLLTVIGLPWLMNRLVRLITERQAAEAARIANLPPGSALQPQFDQFGRPIPTPQPTTALDPSQLVFMRALHSYTPPPESKDKELEFEKDDIIAILSTKEERESMGWWMGRKRDGTVGWVPGTWLAEIPGISSTSNKKSVD
ncbi:peroxin PEX13 [Sporobolomyces koalae]|uniref:peroxin PEX13 n=1 Tax=Sporobolomyces koalae TaxID=500713 RepID=UPI003170B5C8